MANDHLFRAQNGAQARRAGGNAIVLIGSAERLLRDGYVRDAERLLRRALDQSPGQPAAVRMLGAILLDQERYAEAGGLISPVAQLRPNDAPIQALWGRCLCHLGQMDAAVGVLGRALRLAPELFEARLWLGRTLTAMQRPLEALSMLEPLLKSHPSDGLVQTAAGQAWMGLGDERAIGHFQAAASLTPGAARTSDLGWALKVAGRREEALEQFEAALAADPTYAMAVAGKVSVLAGQGRREEARQVVAEALGRGVLDSTLATTYARLSQTPEQRKDARRVLDRALAARQSPTAERSWLLRAKGNLLETDGDYDGAFAAFRDANAAFGPAFDLAEYEREMRRIMEVFGRGAQSLRPRASTADPLPVFIVGMPRSGTSLVEQILASHPRVYGAGELGDMGQLVGELPARLGRASGPFPLGAAALSQEEVDRLAGGHLAALRAMGGSAERVTDKMPQNYVFLGLIDLLFPGARVIHCVRDPLDTCLSCYTTAFSVHHPYRSRLSDLAGVFRIYREMMAHWRDAVRVPILDVRYEDLVAEPERMTRGLVEFAGLEWDDACLRFHENRRVVRTASAEQVRRPMYDSSVGRWKKYEKHLGELVEGLRGLL